MKSIATWNLVARSLAGNIGVMLLYVLESRGSSPGRQGFFMAVNANGEMEGSIGGGIMEHKFVEMVKERLKVQGTRHKTSAFIKASADKADIRKQIHDKAAARDQSGMICSGEQTILLYPVKKEDTVTIQNIITSLEQNKNGSLRLSPGGIFFLENIPLKDFHFSMVSEEDWEYEEKTGYKNQLFIVGGGHCALALSRLMSQMDFYIRLYDDRSELATLAANDFAHEKIIVNDYAELSTLIPSGPNHYVLIMTVGYRTDDIAVRALLNKEFRYVGLLGSQFKTNKMLEEYHKEGIKSEWLQRIHTPVGLAIKSQTPEEIAVSIAAEIIQIKNKDLGLATD